MRKIIFCLSAAVSLLVSGCAGWFCDDRPVPVKPPYESGKKTPDGKNTDGKNTDEEAVNAMVTAISMKAASSGLGPFVFVQDKNFPCSKLGTEVLGALYRMRVSTASGRLMLVLYDEINPQGEWTVKLIHYKTDKVFFVRTLPLSR